MSALPRILRGATLAAGYRDTASRKERMRDYLRMANEMKKDAFRAQKDAQKEVIKRQRGW